MSFRSRLFLTVCAIALCVVAAFAPVVYPYYVNIVKMLLGYSLDELMLVDQQPFAYWRYSFPAMAVLWYLIYRKVARRERRLMALRSLFR